MLFYKWFLSDGVSSLMLGMEEFHDNLMLMLVGISVFVGGLLVSVWYNSGIFLSSLEKEFLEMIWTIFPMLILVSISFPSIFLLFSQEKKASHVSDSIFFKVMGHQWYWSYEYSIQSPETEDSLCYDSFMVPVKESFSGDLIKLDVDKPLNMFSGTENKVLGSSADVIHSFAIPSFGIKVDCVPGRLNQSSVFPLFPGLFYGQCSEICGANHSFMPICVQVLSGVFISASNRF